MGVETTYDFMFEFAGSDEASAKALTSLYRWLRGDESVAGDVKVEFVAESETERMGAADVLCTVLSQLTAIGSLAVSVAAWRESRTAVPPLRIRFGGATLEIPDATAGQLVTALHTLAAIAEPVEPAAEGEAAPLPANAADPAAGKLGQSVLPER